MSCSSSKIAADAYKLVVAEDSPAIQRVFQAFPMTELLIQAIVTSRQELREVLARGEVVDAIVCADHLAGRYGGVHALKELREGRLLPPDTAFLLMSNDARKSNLMVDIDARPDALILKPFAPATLMRLLSGAVQARRALAPLYSLEQQQDWRELLQVATLRLAHGTAYPGATELFKLQALDELGHREASLALYRELLQTSPNAVAVLERYARYAYRQGLAEEAEHTLARLLALQPENLFAADLMSSVLFDKRQYPAAQHRLAMALKHSNSVPQLRVLGHLAILNKDTATAQQAYGQAMRQHAATDGLAEDDVVNVARALLLHGDTVQAWRVVVEARKARPESVSLEVIARFTEAIHHREFEAFGKTQRRITAGLELMDSSFAQHEGVVKLAATEASLMASLPHRAHRLSCELIHEDSLVPLHPAQKSWAEKLHKWSADVRSEEMPAGLQSYYKYMK